jgi:hypothetical protein
LGPDWIPAAGLHVGHETGYSVVLGGGPLIREDLTGEHQNRALLALVEPGTRGGRLSLGYGGALGNLAGGWVLRGTFLQHWSSSHERYGGIELSVLPILAAGIRVGAFLPALNGRVRWTTDFELAF